MNYKKNIGKFVRKESGKTFKSGLRVELVDKVIDHPILHIPAYTFINDDSYVECRQCVVINDLDEVKRIIGEDIKSGKKRLDEMDEEIKSIKEKLKNAEYEKWSAQVRLKYWFTEEEVEAWARELLTEIEERKKIWNSLIVWRRKTWKN